MSTRLRVCVVRKLMLVQRAVLLASLPAPSGSPTLVSVTDRSRQPLSQLLGSTKLRPSLRRVGLGLGTAMMGPSTGVSGEPASALLLPHAKPLTVPGTCDSRLARPAYTRSRVDLPAMGETP